MSGHRQAAIALHAVSAADRRLILAELPAADRVTLTVYLRELKELGFDGADADDGERQCRHLGSTSCSSPHLRWVLPFAASPSLQIDSTATTYPP